MINYGRSVRWYNDYKEECEFSKNNGFEFMQIWYVKGEIALENVPSPKERYVRECGFPVIIHALYSLEDFGTYDEDLIRILKYLGHSEVIIHPICKEEERNNETIFVLSDLVGKTNEALKSEGIKLYIENNSRLDKLNYTAEDINIMFKENPDVGFLLDIAHIDSYKHLENMIEAKFPQCVHISDKHFNVTHEHLPIGEGELDFDTIFNKYLQGYSGRIIFEVDGSDSEIINSLKVIKSCLDV